MNCDLPIRPGKIRHIVDTDTLLQIPGAVSAYMKYAVGDVIGSTLDSSATTGLVFLRAENEAMVDQRVRELAALYVLDVTPAL
ncbi:hypothetical protein QMK19_07075 [Streptomyces sp. H10-C2]|uniref:hypothetical protein n=1 Tax=unclassified Streptomyces TaxID=2593676 RepID=UPI0024BA49F8|nr:MULTISPECIES: hypothetical protein [unclassified Streptomyces]MDJ0341207.1 hypothetical protein [Streptomyces sp. PH10-H1]MDJ0369440.1 hypothetical protein [Streptomyces sp. H10-C2]